MSCEIISLPPDCGRTGPRSAHRRLWLPVIALWLVAGCGYHHYAGPLQPVDRQAASMTIADDGGVTYVQGRFEVRLRPVSDDELNRQFSKQSRGGAKSINPYTYGDIEFYEGRQKRQRFTVFSMSVKNYEYPKVKIDPARVRLLASNGRQYWSLSLKQLDNYYRIYATAYEGNAYTRYRARRDLLLRTMFPAEEIFSGQEAEGFIVFPSLHPDVDLVSLVVHDLVLRFDYRDEPVETVDLSYEFRRDIGRLYPDGTVELSASN